eukprot:COSAG02_NODE_122_length_35306_cov_98.280967_22_plen_59_part_00
MLNEFLKCMVQNYRTKVGRIRGMHTSAADFVRCPSQDIEAWRLMRAGSGQMLTNGRAY